MLEMAAFGSEEFALGFQLAGIKKTIVAGDNPYAQMQQLIAGHETGIVITDEATMEKLRPFEREEIEDSASPVFIVVSKSADDERLRRIIIETIGVDIWQQK